MSKISRYVSTSSHGGMVKVTCPGSTDGTYVKSEDYDNLCETAAKPRTIAEDNAHAKGLVAAGAELMREAARVEAKKRLDSMSAPGYYYMIPGAILDIPNPTPTDLAEYAKTIADKARREVLKEIEDTCLNVAEGNEFISVIRIRSLIEREEGV